MGLILLTLFLPSNKSRQQKIAVMTNGYRLIKNVNPWKSAGLTDINVSVDSIDLRQFLALTGVR